MTDLPLTAPNDKRSSPKPQTSVSIEQAERRCQALEAELERLRQAATADLQNLQHDLVAKNREIGRLKAELAEHAEDQPEAQDAKKLLLLWRDTVRKGHKGIDVTLDSDRGRAVIRAIRKRGADRVRKAILGVQFDEWAMGRTSKQDRAYNDIAKHILKDSDRFEHFEKLFEEHHPEGANAQLKLTDREPESHERQFVRWVYGEDCKLQHRPASKEPRSRPSEPVPIDKVLHALYGRDCHVTAHDSQPDSWSAQCPAHDDRDPSLAVHRKPDGQILLHCFAGCLTEDVLTALGLEWRDLWERSEDDINAAGHAGRAEPVIAPHLRTAMRQLLDRDERQAAA